MVFFSLDDMENKMEKDIKESMKENIVLFSLKNNEENKRKREGQRGGENFIGLLFTETSPLTSSSSVVMASHRRRPFQ